MLPSPPPLAVLKAVRPGSPMSRVWDLARRVQAEDHMIRKGLFFFFPADLPVASEAFWRVQGKEDTWLVGHGSPEIGRLNQVW